MSEKDLENTSSSVVVLTIVTVFLTELPKKKIN